MTNLDIAMKELEETYTRFEEEMERAAMYERGNRAYRAAFVEPFSPAYRCGSSAYVGDDVPYEVFALFYLLIKMFPVLQDS